MLSRSGADFYLAFTRSLALTCHCLLFVTKKAGTHDLVIASHTLCELPSRKARNQLLLSLWERTRHYLVLTDHGSLGGFQLILQARQLLTKEVEGGLEPATIVAPVSGPRDKNLNAE